MLMFKQGFTKQKISKVYGEVFADWLFKSEAEKLKILEGLRDSNSSSPIESFNNKVEKVKIQKSKTTKAGFTTPNPLPPAESRTKGVNLSILYDFTNYPAVELYNGSYKDLKIYKDKELKELYKTAPAYSSITIERLPNGRYFYYAEEVFETIEVKVPTSPKVDLISL